MFYSVLTYYFFIKIVFFYALVRAQIKSDLIKEHYLFLSILYTAAVAFLSFVFLVSWLDLPSPPWQVRVAASLGVSPWQAWLGETFLLSTLYFWLMSKFDEGVIFWTLLLLGIVVVWF